MKSKKINLTQLRNSEHYEFHQEALDFFKAAGPEALKIKPQYDAYKLLFGEEDDVMKVISKSALTARIHDADHARDTTFRGMANANLSAIDHFMPAVSAAAVNMQIVFDAYGHVDSRPLAEQTADIQNLLQDLSVKHAADVEKVGLGPWIGELDKRNNAVRQLMEERYTESGSDMGRVLREVRLRVDASYHRLMLCVDALCIMSEGGGGAAAYENLIRNLNALIDRANNILAARRGRAAAKKESGE